MGVVVRRPAHTGSEVSCGVGQWPLLNVCAVSPCGFCVLIVGWVQGFSWPD